MDEFKNNNVDNHDTEPTEVMDTTTSAENQIKAKPNVKDVFKQKTVRAAICAVLGVAVVGGGAYAATAGLRNTNSTAAPAITATQVAYEEDDSIESIKLNYTADGLKEDSTPVIVHIIGQAVADTSVTTAEETTADYTSDDVKPAAVDIDFYHAFSAKDILDGKATVDVQKGTYQIAVLPSLNADGSLNSGTTEAIDAKGNTETSKEENTEAEAAASTVAATTDKADTKAEDKTSVATSKSESTKTEEKKPEAATTTVAKTDAATESKTEDTKSDTTEDKAAAEDDKSSTVEVKGETTKAEDVSKEQIDKVLNNLDEAVKKGDSSLTGDKGTTVTDDYKKAAEANPNTKTEEVEEKTEDTKKQATTEKSQAKTDSSNSSTSTSNKNNNNNSSNQQQSQPTHTHNWIAQYKTVADYSDVWVQDSAAWDEQVLVSGGYYETVVVGHYAIFGNGERYDYTNNYDLAMRQKDLGGMNYSVYDEYDSIYHDPVYNTVHHDATGHYESRQTGSHQEVNGYKCSSCGATK